MHNLTENSLHNVRCMPKTQNPEWNPNTKWIFQIDWLKQNFNFSTINGVYTLHLDKDPKDFVEVYLNLIS